MKKYNHPIDDFLRETFKDHQVVPSDAAKKAFLKDALQVSSVPKRRRKGLILLTAFLGLAVSGIFIWGVTSDIFDTDLPAESNSIVQSMPTIENDQSTVQRQKTIQDQQKPPTHKTEPLRPYKQSLKQVTAQNIPVSWPVLSNNESNSSLQSPVNAASYVENEKVKTAGISLPDNNSTTVAAKDTVKTREIWQADVVNPDPDPVSMIKGTDSLLIPGSAVKEMKSDLPGKIGRRLLSLGVYYTPEMMFGTLEGDKFVNNFGIEGTFHIGRFSIRSGAGLSIAKGTNELMVAYNDFLGAFNKLDSMAFNWSPPAQQFIPKFYTTNQDVWDSLMKIESARIVKRYTYLQVPLIMGYDFWQTDRISVGVRVGPVLSILTTSKQLSAAYDPGKKRIISINDIAPEQVSLNWQAMAGISASIRINESLNIEFEPFIKYYFNSVYERPANHAKPWSIGLRAALTVKF
ncbi:MAG: hypothetical protein Q8M08_07250 [Bacteroidales bacterium]|nr:hypothetical protein [Bacteroidales bacterium]